MLLLLTMSYYISTFLFLDHMSVVAKNNFTCFNSLATFSFVVEYNDGSAVCEKYLRPGIW